MNVNKFKAALLAISVSIILVILKVVIGIITNSISIISDALHSFMDILASSITLAAMYFAAQPPDKCHNYGHGRYEDLAAVLQSILIFIFSITIIFQGLSRIFTQNYLNETVPGIIVMSLSITLHSITVLTMLKYAKKEESIALKANALHLLADVLTSIGVIIGLIVIHFTGVKIIDPIVGIIVALVIIKTGYDIGKESIGQLLDTSLSKEELNIVIDKIHQFIPPILSYHHLRTRRVGNHRYIDFHILFPDDFTLHKAHSIASNLEMELQKSIPNLKTTIHLEPKSHFHPKF